MLVGLQIMGCFTHMEHHPCEQVSVMQTGQGVLMIEKAPLEDVSSLEAIWFLGLVRSKTVCPCQRQRLNI